MRYNAHFGVLPLGAFEHCGDGKIKPHGGGSIPIVSDVVDIVGDVVEDVGDFVGDTVEGVGDSIGAFVEDPLDFVGNVIESIGDDPVKAAAIVAAAYFAPELLAELGVTQSAAAAEFMAADAANLAAQGLSQAQIAQTLSASYGVNATVAANVAAATSNLTPQQLSSYAVENLSPVTTDYLGATSLGDAATGAVGSGKTGIGLSAGTASGGAAAGTGISTGALEGMQYLGGAGTLPIGTAGLTAEQIAAAGEAGKIGSNVESGLGYLGGAESLPSGTAGIQGVTPPAGGVTVKDAAKIAEKVSQLVQSGGQAGPLVGAGIGALAAINAASGDKSVPYLGLRGAPLEYTAERIPSKGVRYTPKMAAEGGLMNLIDPSNSVAMYQSGGITEAEDALAKSMKATAGQSVGIANQMNYLLGRGLSPEQAKQIIQQGVNVYSFAQGGMPAASMGGGDIYRAAEKAGIGTSPAALNKIVDLVNNGMSIEQAISMLSQNKAGGGGISDLGSYTHATGGRMLKGPGDGMSDSIPATIEGKRPARLATDEFVVPADVVSHLGNGSSDAGAKVLYEMMDKVRKARTGTTKQGKQINPKKYLPK